MSHNGRRPAWRTQQCASGLPILKFTPADNFTRCLGSFDEEQFAKLTQNNQYAVSKCTTCSAKPRLFPMQLSSLPISTNK